MFLAGNIDFADLTDVSSLPTVLKLIKIPQLVKQACEIIGTISENTATSDMDTVQQLAAPSVIMAIADALASDRRSVCAAAEAVRALAGSHCIAHSAQCWLSARRVFAKFQDQNISLP